MINMDDIICPQQRIVYFLCTSSNTPLGTLKMSQVAKAQALASLMSDANVGICLCVRELSFL